MRRADRLFQLVQILRRRRLTTARHLAEALGISERTVYRDIRDLSASGVPVEGEAGVGYRLRGFDLPPLMFTREEVEALVLGARIVQISPLIGGWFAGVSSGRRENPIRLLTASFQESRIRATDLLFSSFYRTSS